MKKVFTLLLASVLSVLTFAQTAQMPDLKAMMQKEKFGMLIQAQEQPAQKKALAAKTPAATAFDTMEVRFNSFYSDPIFYEPDEWYIVLRNERYQFIFDIYGCDPNDPSGTYTQDDLDISFSWCAIPEAPGKTCYYKNCELTVKAEKVSDNLTKYIVDAVVLVTKGIDGEEMAIYKIHAEHKTITAKMKMDVAILNCAVTPEEDRFRIAGKNDTMEVDMTLFSDFGVVGYYTEDYIDYDYTKINHRGVDYEVMDMEGVIYTADMMSGGLAYVFMTEILTTDTCFFNVAMEAPVIPTDTVRINCNNMVMDDTYGASEATITITATDGKYSVLAGYNDTQINSPATYTGQQAMVYVTDLSTDKEISSMACTIEVTGNPLKGYNVTIEMLGNDHKYYVLTMQYKIPTPVKTVALNFEQCAKSMYYIDDLGLEELQLANYNGEYSVSIDILHIDQVLLTEEFDKTNLFLDQTFIIHHFEDYDVNVPIAKINGTIKQQHDTTFLTAKVIGFDSVQYDIQMYHAIPTPTETITYTFDALGNDDVKFTNALPDPSYSFILEAMSEDGNLMATVQVKRTKTVEGTFYNDGKFTHNDFDANNTFVQVWNEELEDYETFSIEKGTMTVTIDENKIITAVASLIAEDAKQYNLTFKVPYERARLPFDAEYPEVEYTYGTDAIISVDNFIASDNLIFFEILAADYSSVTSLVFYIDHLDDQITIPEGVYPIATATSPATLGTVHASPGMSVGGGPIQSYYAQLEVYEEEIYYKEDGCYFLIDGKVTVENVDGRLKLDIDAVNSYDLSVKLHYMAPKTNTAVENVESAATVASKYLHQGQLLIKQNEHIYNATGVRVK